MEGSLAGRLLVAAPPLVDSNFDRTVVWILDHDEDGALGVILNRPSSLEVADVLPGWEDLAAEPGLVFLGGPVGPQGALCLAPPPSSPVGEVASAYRPTPSGLVLVDLDAAPEVRAALPFHRVRVFAGHAGWAPGQLESERDAGGWYVVDALPDDPWSPRPEQLWRDVLRRQPGRLRLLATYPPDPSLN